jgi:hypothetical protein
MYMDFGAYTFTTAKARDFIDGITQPTIQFPSVEGFNLIGVEVNAYGVVSGLINPMQMISMRVTALSGNSPTTSPVGYSETGLWIPKSSAIGVFNQTNRSLVSPLFCPTGIQLNSLCLAVSPWSTTSNVASAIIAEIVFIGE